MAEPTPTLIAILTIRLLTALIRPIPWRWLPTLASGIGWILEVVVRYRRQVILANLAYALPGSKEAHRAIRTSCYRNLALVTLETFKGYSSRIGGIRDRMVVHVPDWLTRLIASGDSLVVGANHYENFEFLALTIPSIWSMPTAGIWKPFKDPRVGDFIRAAREKGGMTLVANRGAIRNLTDLAGQSPHAFFFLADQSPSNAEMAHWVTFLGQETAFIPGVEVLARKLEIPVVYAALRRRSDGRHDLHFHLLAEHPSELPETEITRRYAARIEADILDGPGAWLWTHKRWKKQRRPAQDDEAA